jgi:hypothetical protein
VKVGRCRVEVAVPKENLNRAEIHALFKKVGRKTMPVMPGPA